MTAGTVTNQVYGTPMMEIARSANARAGAPSAKVSAEAMPADARAGLRQAADEVVGQVFYGSLLRQLRSSSLKGTYGHGGRGEKVFQSQLDAVLAAQAGQARSTDLTQAIVDRFGRQAINAQTWRQRQEQALKQVQREIEAPRQTIEAPRHAFEAFGQSIEASGQAFMEKSSW